MRILSECNLCGSRDLRPYAVSFGNRAVHHAFAKCRGCGIYFANPMRTEEELNEFYASEYYEESGGSVIERFDAMKAEAAEVIRTGVVPLQPPPGDFLEVGSGYGPTLAAAREIGYSVTGIELSRDGRDFATREHGLDVRGTPLEACNFSNDSFDVIFAWHVIEHVPDMARFLKEVRRVLKPSGLLFFGTENYRCVSNLFSRAHHVLTGALPGIDTADEHTFLFTPTTVRSIFPRFGYKVEDVHTYQPQDKREAFLAPARKGSAAKRAVHHAVLGTVFGIADVWPNGGAHMTAAVRRHP